MSSFLIRYNSHCKKQDLEILFKVQVISAIESDNHVLLAILARYSKFAKLLNEDLATIISSIIRPVSQKPAIRCLVFLLNSDFANILINSCQVSLNEEIENINHIFTKLSLCTYQKCQQDFVWQLIEQGDPDTLAELIKLLGPAAYTKINLSYPIILSLYLDQPQLIGQMSSLYTIIDIKNSVKKLLWQYSLTLDNPSYVAALLNFPSFYPSLNAQLDFALTKSKEQVLLQIFTHPKFDKIFSSNLVEALPAKLLEYKLSTQLLQTLFSQSKKARRLSANHLHNLQLCLAARNLNFDGLEIIMKCSLSIAHFNRSILHRTYEDYALKFCIELAFNGCTKQDYFDILGNILSKLPGPTQEYILLYLYMQLYNQLLTKCQISAPIFYDLAAPEIKPLLWGLFNVLENAINNSSKFAKQHLAILKRLHHIDADKIQEQLALTPKNLQELKPLPRAINLDVGKLHLQAFNRQRNINSTKYSTTLTFNFNSKQSGTLLPAKAVGIAPKTKPSIQLSRRR